MGCFPSAPAEESSTIAAGVTRGRDQNDVGALKLAQHARSNVAALDFKGLRLLFVRHAQAEGKSSRVGRSVQDPKLSGVGEEQAEALARRLYREEGATGLDVVCSPMERCVRTAYPLVSGQVGRQNGVNILSGRRAVCHALFCEHGNDPASFDRQRIAEGVPEFFGAGQPHEVDFVGFGENVGSLEVPRTKAGDDAGAVTISRASKAAEWLVAYAGERHSGGAALAIFSHQTFLDCLLQILVDGDADRWEYGSPKFKFGNTALYELRALPGAAATTKHRICAHGVMAYVCAGHRRHDVFGVLAMVICRWRPTRPCAHPSALFWLMHHVFAKTAHGKVARRCWRVDRSSRSEHRNSGSMLSLASFVCVRFSACGLFRFPTC